MTASEYRPAGLGGFIALMARLFSVGYAFINFVDVSHVACSPEVASSLTDT